MVVGDPGWRFVRVFLDGVECPNVVEADEDRRYVKRIVRDDRGRLLLAEDGKNIKTETLCGHVVILRGGVSA